MTHSFPLFPLLLMVLGLSSPAHPATWQPLGPFGGHAFRILTDSADVQRLYVFTKNGQLFVSDNGGEMWQPRLLSLPGTAVVNAAVIDPRGSGVLYIGVSDGLLGPAASFAGIYRSEDKGNTWKHLAQTAQWPVLSLAIFPGKPDVIVAGTRDGVYRSASRGEDWKRLSPPNHPELRNVVSLAVDPMDSQIIYAGTPHLPWRTLDGGEKWTSIAEGMSDDSDVFSLAVDRERPGAIYASACSGIYRSSTHGSLWERAQDIPSSNRRTHVILQDPTDANKLYAGTTQGLWKSNDRGKTWQKPNPYPFFVNSIVVHPREPNIVYMATDRSSILKSTDGGVSFRSVNEGFVNRNVTSFAGGSRLYVSTVYDGDFGGIFSSKDEGHTWTLTARQADLHDRNILSLAVPPSRPNLVLAGTYEGLMKSEDGGSHWQLVEGSEIGWAKSAIVSTSPRRKLHRLREVSLAPPVQSPKVRFHELVFSKPLPDRVYAASSAGLFVSQDDGGTWQRLPSLETRDVSRIVLHPTNPNWIMVQASDDLLISDSAGAHWGAASPGGKEIEIHDFAFGPQLPIMIWIGTSRGLYRSQDGGRTWDPQRGGLPLVPIHHVCPSPDNLAEIFVQSNATDQVYVSTDGGNNWSPLDHRGLEGVTVQALLAGAPGSRALLALTQGRGLFKCQLEP